MTLTKKVINAMTAAQVVTAGTRVRFNSATSVKCKKITVTADPGNAGVIYLGASDVTASKCVVLAAGATYVFDAGMGPGGVEYYYDLADLWVDAANSAEFAFAIYETTGQPDYTA